MTTPVQLTYPGATVDTLLETVNGSNLSATHKITRSATLVIAANDSSEKSKAQADYVCDGVADDDEINAAITAISTTGGKIILTEGNFSLSNKVSSAANVVISGVGTGATNITQTAQSTTAFELGANDYTGLQNLTIIMPSSNSGDAVTVGSATESTGQILENLRFARGDSLSYAIRVTNAFEFSIAHISFHKTLGLASNGILFENTANDYNYGNAKISNISLFCAANTKGISIVGAVSKNYNLMEFSAINLISSVANGQIGINIETGSYMSFNMIDLEFLETGIKLSNASRNYFAEVYSTCTTDINISAGYKNIFVACNCTKIIESTECALLSHQNVFLGYPLSWMSAKVVQFFDDFVGANLSGVWRSVGTVALSGGTNVLLTTAATTGDKASIDFGGNRGYKDDYGTYFETKIRRGETSGYDVKFGLTDGGFEATNIGAWWQQLSSGTTWLAVCCDGTTMTAVDTGISRSASAHVFSILKTLTAIEFYSDGVLAASITTNRPGVSTLREPLLEITTQGNYVHNLYIDSVLVKAGRLITP
ncbi:MAG: hypothetical protein PHW20_07365 [Clostridia bacterium]|nr:hypothetical protein [Clostridia bacterium]